jgi:hypothetical protein
MSGGKASHDSDESRMQVFVRRLTEPHVLVPFDVKSSDTIDTLKLQISEKLLIPADDQTLIFGGRVLENGHTLAHYNIQNQSTLTVMPFHNVVVDLFHNPDQSDDNGGDDNDNDSGSRARTPDGVGTARYGTPPWACENYVDGQEMCQYKPCSAAYNDGENCSAQWSKTEEGVCYVHCSTSNMCKICKRIWCDKHAPQFMMTEEEDSHLVPNHGGEICKACYAQLTREREWDVDLRKWDFNKRWHSESRARGGERDLWRQRQLDSDMQSAFVFLV